MILLEKKPFGDTLRTAFLWITLAEPGFRQSIGRLHIDGVSGDRFTARMTADAAVLLSFCFRWFRSIRALYRYGAVVFRKLFR